MSTTRRYAFGRTDEMTHPDSIRAAVSEFVSTFVFVFAGEGTALALAKMYGGSTMGASGLVALALAHAFSLFVAVAMALNISGGHVNPAVTFGALVGGRITLLNTVMYWIAQLLGALLAAILLRVTNPHMSLIGFGAVSGVSVWNALIMEIIMTFGLVYTVYATAIDPKRGSLGTIAPLAIGLVVGAFVLVGGPISGAAMNPARAFGPALIGGRWRHHWIYWVGPFVGGGLAGLLYGFVMIPTEVPRTHQPLAPEDY